MLSAVFNSLHPSVTKHSPYCSLYISHGIDMENLFNNQEFLECGVTIFCILTTFMLDSAVIMYREIGD